MKLDASRVLIFTATILVAITSCVPEAKINSSYASDKTETTSNKTSNKITKENTTDTKKANAADTESSSKKNISVRPEDHRADTKNSANKNAKANAADTENSATIFLTGTTLSTLKPCGCAGGQLGGFDRRAAIFNKTNAEKRMIIDTGKLLADNTEQDQLKMIMAMQAMSQLQYDAVNLSGIDLEVAKEMGLLEGTDLNIISSEKPDKTGETTAKIAPIFTKKIKVGKSELKVKIGIIDTVNGDSEGVLEKMDADTTPGSNTKNAEVYEYGGSGRAFQDLMRYCFDKIGVEHISMASPVTPDRCRNAILEGA